MVSVRATNENISGGFCCSLLCAEEAPLLQWQQQKNTTRQKQRQKKGSKFRCQKQPTRNEEEIVLASQIQRP